MGQFEKDRSTDGVSVGMEQMKEPLISSRIGDSLGLSVDKPLGPGVGDKFGICLAW